MAASSPQQVPNTTSYDINWTIFEDNDVIQIFGFSNVSANYFEASDICQSHGANFSLASLETNFYSVASYIADNYKTHDSFWVDATKQYGC